MCFSLVAELKRQIADFPEVSSGVLVQQVIADTPAQKYVHTHVQKPEHTQTQHWRNLATIHQSSQTLNVLGFIKWFHAVIYYLWTIRTFFNKWWYTNDDLWHNLWPVMCLECVHLCYNLCPRLPCSKSLTPVSFLCVFFRGGIKEGDIIVKLNGQPVQTTEDIREVLQHDQPLLLEIRRGNDDLLFNIYPQVIAHWRTGQFICFRCEQMLGRTQYSGIKIQYGHGQHTASNYEQAIYGNMNWSVFSVMISGKMRKIKQHLLSVFTSLMMYIFFDGYWSVEFLGCFWSHRLCSINTVIYYNTQNTVEENVLHYRLCKAQRISE